MTGDKVFESLLYFITKEEFRQFIILLNPLAPHITSELYEIVFGKQILDDCWPKYQEKYLSEGTIQIPVQINSKKACVITAEKDIEQDALLSLVKESYPEKFNFEPKKVIYVPNKIMNLIK